MKQFQQMKKAKSSQQGFTLIELIIVIVIAGILGSALVATYVDLSGEAETANRQQSENAVQTQFATLIAQNSGTLPTVTELATAMGPNATAEDIGVAFDSTGDGTDDTTVLTFTDRACDTATTAAGDSVACVQGYDVSS